VSRLSLIQRVTRGRFLSTGGPNLGPTKESVTEGCHPSLWYQVPVGGVAGFESQPVRSLSSAQRRRNMEAIDRRSYVVAVISAVGRIAEADAVTARFLPCSVTSIFPREIPLCWQALTADAKLLWSRLKEMECLFSNLIINYDADSLSQAKRTFYNFLWFSVVQCTSRKGAARTPTMNSWSATTAGRSHL